MSAMPTIERDHAVVAVDGSDEGLAAVAVASHEALRHDLALRVVHVMPVWEPLGPWAMQPVDPGFRAYASESLARASRVAAEAEPQLEISTHVLLGPRVSEIVRFARRARWIAVGRRPDSALDRAWSGGTLDGVVSRAHCPVLVVPSVRRSEGRPARVVAGFKSADHAAELYDEAFRVADELDAELEVVHAWKVSSGYDDVIARRVSEATCNRDRRRAIRDLLAPWQEAYPNTPVRVRVVHDHPVRVLVDASRQADRLVLVKPRHGSLVHHLGRTARGALRFAQCPIEVVPASARDAVTVPPVTVEKDGALVR